jgi:AcrR family transcriptional regulator
MNTNSVSPVPRPDRRVSRTRRQLRDALIALIIEKGYDDITIEDITDRADLGRTTFYLHYHGKEDLLLESIGDTAQELYEQVNAGFTQGAKRNAQTAFGAIQQVFQHAGQNSLLYRIILKGGAASKVQRFLQDILKEGSWPFFSQGLATGTPHAIPLEVLTNYFATALLGFITWWLEADMPYPPDQAAGYFAAILYSGIRGIQQTGGIVAASNPAPEIKPKDPGQDRDPEEDS